MNASERICSKKYLVVKTPFSQGFEIEDQFPILTIYKKNSHQIHITFWFLKFFGPYFWSCLAKYTQYFWKQSYFVLKRRTAKEFDFFSTDFFIGLALDLIFTFLPAVQLYSYSCFLVKESLIVYQSLLSHEYLSKSMKTFLFPFYPIKDVWISTLVSFPISSESTEMQIKKHFLIATFDIFIAGLDFCANDNEFC